MILTLRTYDNGQFYIVIFIHHIGNSKIETNLTKREIKKDVN